MPKSLRERAREKQKEGTKRRAFSHVWSHKNEDMDRKIDKPLLHEVKSFVSEKGGKRGTEKEEDVVKKKPN